MDAKAIEILGKLKGERVGIFCDGANMFYGSQKYGWRIDVGKLRRLISNYGKVILMNYYMAVPARNDIAFFNSQKFIEKIKDFVTVKSKELKYIPVGGQVIKKGNMDVEITLDVIRNIDALDVIVILSGDSDFVELKNYITRESGKKIMFIGYKGSMGWEIKKCWHMYFEQIKDDILLE